MPQPSIAAAISGASRPISNTARALASTAAFSGAEILPLAVAAQDHHRFAAAHAVQRGLGGADVGALGVVVTGDAFDLGDFFDPVRQPLEMHQPAQQRLAIGKSSARVSASAASALATLCNPATCSADIGISMSPPRHSSSSHRP